ncbi:AraC family transcriptional regulator [Anatilimnocola sp. NA78]|uniref:AraC family transcriptional regulator n=1 Tax=Anatilimnocola sp. NA78 TaxID=3415683 RepID=UPI003CE4AF82
MTVADESSERLAFLLNKVAIEEGVHNTLVDGVRVARHSTVLPRTPVVYEPAIVIVGQGRKRSYVGDQIYDYGSSSYFVLSVPLPAECEWEATPEKPVLVVGVRVDPAILGEVVLEMDESTPPQRELPRGVTTRPLSCELSGAVIRLLECLQCPVDSRVLGRGIIREIVYRALREDQDGALRALANRDGNFMRIAKVLKEVHADCAKPFTVDNMSKRAGMSVAAFHHNFKLVAGSSPLQYLKRIRLDRAKRLMIHDGYNAGTAAKAVGYESASQFSREFKRQFGTTPMEDTDRLRQPVEKKSGRRRSAYS